MPRKLKTRTTILDRDAWKKPFEAQAYRGYLIQFHALQNAYWVEKDGFLICWAQTITEARSRVDSLFSEEVPPIVQEED